MLKPGMKGVGHGEHFKLAPSIGVSLAWMA